MKEKPKATVDISSDQHTPLKKEDAWLAKKARETLNNIHSGKEKTISWDEMKKRIN